MNFSAETSRGVHPDPGPVQPRPAPALAAQCAAHLNTAPLDSTLPSRRRRRTWPAIDWTRRGRQHGSTRLVSPRLAASHLRCRRGTDTQQPATQPPSRPRHVVGTAPRVALAGDPDPPPAAAALRPLPAAHLRRERAARAVAPPHLERPAHPLRLLHRRGRPPGPAELQPGLSQVAGTVVSFFLSEAPGSC